MRMFYIMVFVIVSADTVQKGLIRELGRPVFKLLPCTWLRRKAPRPLWLGIVRSIS